MGPSVGAASRINTAAECGNEICARLVLAIGLVIAFSTVALVMLVQRPLPFADQWDNIVSGREVSWSWLTSQHNEHRLLFPRIIFWADQLVDNEGNVIDLATNLIIQTITTILFYRLCKSVGFTESNDNKWSFGLILTFMFSAIQSENLTWGFQVQFLGIGLIAVATFSTLVMAPPTLINLVAVVVLEAIGLYTLAGGILIAILTVLLCLWLRRPWYHTALLTAAGIALIGTYLIDYSKPEVHADPMTAILHVDRIVIYVFTELGNPLWALLFLQSPVPAAVFGSLGLILYALIGVRIYRDHERQAGLVLFAIASFAVLMTILTGLGRWTFGAEQALSSRYASPTLLFWLALVLLTTMQLRRFSPRSRTWIPAAGLMLTVLFAVKQPRYILGSVLADLDRQAAVPAVLAGVADPEMMHRLVAPEQVFAARSMLKQAHGSVFILPEADWLDQLLPGGIAALSVSPCAGQYSVAEHLNEPDHSGWRATGTLTERAAMKLSNRMIFVDKEGRVVGFGRSGLTARAVTPDRPGSPPRLSLWIHEVIGGERPDRWIGAFEDVDPVLVKAYVLAKDGTPHLFSRSGADASALRIFHHRQGLWRQFPRILQPSTSPSTRAAAGLRTKGQQTLQSENPGLRPDPAG